MMTARLVEKAPAKINLALHVLGRYADGWHEIESLVAFSGSGDRLGLELGEGLSLDVEGPTASGAGPNDDNLVLRAGRRLMALAPGVRAGRFRLLKRLPAAAGLGGGSSDAAAALRLLARANGLDAGDARIIEAARDTGADVPVCLRARACVMAGVGERLGPDLRLPPVFCALVNPGVALETRAVFARMGLAPGERAPQKPKIELGRDLTASALIERLRGMSNDMEKAARALCPAVGRTLAVLAELPGARLCRMSGSGATCFALFETRREAAAAVRTLRARHPDWWVRATILR